MGRMAKFMLEVSENKGYFSRPGSQTPWILTRDPPVLDNSFHLGGFWYFKNSWGGLRRSLVGWGSSSPVGGRGQEWQKSSPSESWSQDARGVLPGLRQGRSLIVMRMPGLEHICRVLILSKEHSKRIEQSCREGRHQSLVNQKYLKEKACKINVCIMIWLL